MIKKLGLSLLAFGFIFSSFSQELEGRWYGVLSIPGKEFLFGFDLNKDGKLFETKDETKFNSIDSVVIDGNKIIFFSSQIKLQFEGELKSDTIFGFWKQAGMSFPLSLTRTIPSLEATTVKEEKNTFKRPQTPLPPFSYYTEEMVIENTKDSVSLSGTLTLPANDGSKYPVVILITGSKPQNRDSEILGHKSFAVIADHFAKQGIGTFRYDDRGTAKSTGNYFTADLHDFYADLEAVVQVIKQRKEVKSLGLLGHSEGGIIAPWYASEHKKEIDFVVMLAGPGIPVSEMMHSQREFLYKNIGMTIEQIQQQKELFSSIDSIVLITEGAQKTQALSEFLTNHLKNQGASGEALEQGVATFLAELDKAWYKSFVAIVPKDYLQNLKCPLLALGGLKDFQVPTKMNFEGIEQYKKKNFWGKSTLKLISYPNLNHLFQPSVTGGVEEYPRIETTFDRQVLFDMSDFINSL